MKTNIYFRFLIVAFFSGILATAQELPKTPSPEGAEVYIISPKDGETVSSPVTVLFGLKGMGVAPAGIDVPNTGHHHLIVNLKTLPSFDVPLPTSDNVIHFGKGQTETELELPSGKHTLQLVFGDKIHLPHDPPVVSKRITIIVE